MSIDDRLRDALERALADARARLEPDLRAVTHELSDEAAATLASAAAALDRAGSLGGVLDALVEAAGQYTDRVGLFLLRDDGIRARRLTGIGEDDVRLKTELTTGSAGAGRVHADGVTTFPIDVGGQAVAILYADAGASTAPVLDVLTRHAGRILEARTLQMALGMAAR